MAPVFQVVQVALAVLLIIAVLLQQAQGGAGSAFGQSDSFHSTRRGAERLLFNFTIVVAVAFFAVSIGTFKVTG